MVKNRTFFHKKKNSFVLLFVGLTIDRIYSLLEQCTDKQFLICLLSLLRNIFSEKDTEILLPMFNSVKLLSVKIVERQNRLNSCVFLIDFRNGIGKKLSGRNSSGS
jgi:hypothetical protein